MKREKRPQKKKPAPPVMPPPEPGVENTGTLLIRAAQSIEKFDAQLERSRKLKSAVRGGLDAAAHSSSSGND